MKYQVETDKICPFMSYHSDLGKVTCETIDCMAWQSLGKQDTGDMLRDEDRPELGYCKLIDKENNNG